MRIVRRGNAAGQTLEGALKAAIETYGESDIANSFGEPSVIGVENGGNTEETVKEFKRAVRDAFEAVNARGASPDEVSEIEAVVRENF